LIFVDVHMLVRPYYQRRGNCGRSWKAQQAKWSIELVSKPYPARRENRSKWKPQEVYASSVKVYCWRQFIIHYWICYRMLVQTLPCLTQWQVLFQQFPLHFTAPIWTIFASCWDILNLWTDKQAQNKLPEAAHSFTCRITKFTCKILECLQK
jgi:hypothetical protein